MDPDPRLRNSRTALTLAALGVVYGDIGTSPLYAAKETFNPYHGIPLDTANVLGGLSTIFWSLMIVVSLKYVILIMRADNRGEGGIMALLALAPPSAVKDRPHWRAPVILLGLAGAALFYGDAVLTPAISVLSAVEGLEVGTTAFKPYVVPIAVGVVIALFALQRKGTSVVGALFGPVAVLWFLAIAALGASTASPAIPGCCGRSIRCTRCASPRSTAGRRSSCSARCYSRSPARRNSTPTWATSARPRSASHGSRSFSPRSP